MKKTQIDQHNMLLAVENYFDSNASIWTSNIPISDCKTAFSAKLDQIMAAATQQSENSTGVTIDKNILRKDLEEKAFFISSAICGYASVNPGHTKLSKTVYITKTDLSKIGTDPLLVYIENLNAAAITVMENLEPYGVTQATLTNLMAARAAFFDIMNTPKDVVSNRKDATELIPVLLHEAIAMLDNTMDKLIEALRPTERQFVDVYFLERKIHHIGVHTLSLEITTLNANDNTPLNDAHIEVVGKGIKRISNESGRNRVQNLVEGNYTLSVNRLGFVPQMIPFMIISGETTQLVIEMQSVLEEVIE